MTYNQINDMGLTFIAQALSQNQTLMSFKLFGNNFGQEEQRDGDNTRGEYFVNLPDGRLQRVTYSVNGASGFVVDTTVLILLFEVAAVELLLARSIAFIVAASSNWILNRVFTFADACRAAGFSVFGPSKAAARLEASKSFTQDVLAASRMET